MQRPRQLLNKSKTLIEYFPLMADPELQCNKDERYALIVSRLWCKTLGIWPGQCRASSMSSGFLIITEVTAGIFFLERLFRHGKCGLITHLVDGLTGINGCMVTAMKIFLSWSQRERVRHISQLITEDWSNADGASRRIMNQYALWGRLVFIAQITGACLTLLEITVTRPPNFNSEENSSLSERNLILGPSCWIPVTMSFGLYLMYYYATFIGIAVAALMYVGCDGFMFNVALHVCGQFEVLNTSVEEWSDVSNYLEQRQIIGEYCKRHDRLLRLNSQTAHLVKSIILCDLFSNAFLICISGMAIVINIRIGNAEKDIVTLAIRIFICYVGIFMYSYVGEILYSQAQKLRISIYNCPWYNMPVSIAKDINFIIMRSNSICTLTAGGVYVMNLESFKNITKLIFSYFSVLKLMFE